MVKYRWADRTGELLIICVSHFSHSEYRRFLISGIFLCAHTLLMWVISLTGARTTEPMAGKVLYGQGREKLQLPASREVGATLTGAPVPLPPCSFSVGCVSSRIKESLCKSACRVRAGSYSALVLLQLFFWFSGVFGSSWIEQGSEGSIKSSVEKNNLKVSFLYIKL